MCKIQKKPNLAIQKCYKSDWSMPNVKLFQNVWTFWKKRCNINLFTKKLSMMFISIYKIYTKFFSYYLSYLQTTIKYCFMICWWLLDTCDGLTKIFDQPTAMDYKNYCGFLPRKEKKTLSIPIKSNYGITYTYIGKLCRPSSSRKKKTKAREVGTIF